LASVLLTLSVTVSVAAQGTWPVQPGARVRITARARDSSIGKQVGTLLAQRNDTLWLRVQEYRVDTVAFATTHIARVDVSEGIHGHALLGGGIGLLSGVVIGAIAAADDGSGTCTQPDTVGCALAMGVADAVDDVANIALPIVFGLSGALVGAIVGAFVRTDAWVALPGAGRQASLQITPRSKGGVRLGLAVRF
jgi:hypothetical protein